jgi:ubiquinone/menaquinone biosynthesis C-methylase UbiE
MKDQINSPEFEKINKDYYRYQENYDWVKITDDLVGLESFFHRTRQKHFLKILRPHLEKIKPDAILDAGCGTGLFSRHLPPGAMAIDINPRHIAKAKNHAPHINFRTGDLDKLPFEDEKFSLVVCTEVIEHFPDPQKPLQEIKRVLKKNGLLIGTVPNKSWIWHLRWLSSTRPTEPFHNNFKKNEINLLLSDYFSVQLQKKLAYGMNWVFIAQKF